MDVRERREKVVVVELKLFIESIPGILVEDEVEWWRVDVQFSCGGEESASVSEWGVVV